MVILQARKPMNRQVSNRRPKWWLVLAIVGVIIVGNSVWGVYQKYRLATTNVESARQEYAELLMRKRELEASVGRLQSPRGVESEIRKNLHVVKEGEKVITIVDEEESTTTKEIERGFWGKWLR